MVRFRARMGALPGAEFACMALTVTEPFRACKYIARYGTGVSRRIPAVTGRVRGKSLHACKKFCNLMGVKRPVTWPEYVNAAAGDARGADIAAKASVSESTVSRWRSGQVRPDPDQVERFARAYELDPREALRIAGYFAADDMEGLAEAHRRDGLPRALQLRDFTDLELAQEMVRRIAAGESPVLEEPLDQNHPAMENVSPIRKDAGLRPEPVPAEDVPADIADRRPAAKKPTRERATKKAALTDPEMNQDETFE